MWLVVYDIPEEPTRKRDKFREFLTEIGCRMVQESVWLSVKDPRRWLRIKIDSLRIQGKVIVSCLGKDGSFGDEDVVEMISRVFGWTGEKAFGLFEKKFRHHIQPIGDYLIDI